MSANKSPGGTTVNSLNSGNKTSFNQGLLHKQSHSAQKVVPQKMTKSSSGLLQN